MKPSDTLDIIRDLFAVHGEETYGERINMAEHSLLTAQAARRAGATQSLVVAALLHDLGHFLEAADDEYGHHDHGETAARFLETRFPPPVVEPIRLHIEAKRYLCAVDPGYHDQLSPASQYTLTRQGGVMGPEEATAFASRPYAAEAVELRRWEDEHGKSAPDDVPSFSDFETALLDQHL